MAYTPKTWECGETITADDLNHIEQGIAEASSGGGTAPFLIFKAVSTETTTEPCPDNENGNIHIITTTWNYSWQEIYDALNSETPVFFVDGESATWLLVSNAYFFDGSYIIRGGGEGLVTFESATTKVTVYQDESECGGK